MRLHFFATCTVVAFQGSCTAIDDASESPQEGVKILLQSSILPQFVRANALCSEYCKLYDKAILRCPYAVPEEIANDHNTCVADCIHASFSTSDPSNSFDTDSIQCRMNHARMAIKQGPLTNTMHCSHATLAGPYRCTQDATAIQEKRNLALGKQIFFSPSVWLADGNPLGLTMIQSLTAAIFYLISLRGRLYIAYPSEVKNKVKLDCKSTDLRYRSADGTCNSVSQPFMGAVGESFTRNLKGSAPHKDGYPDVAQVAGILKREDDSNKVAPFNQLTSAWIQFMTHDWFNHDKEESPGSSMRNIVTHWWDASQIYGSSDDQIDTLRVPGGKLHLDENDEIDYDSLGNPKTGFGDNFFSGLHVLHTIFAREHNYLVDTFSSMYPDMTDDEKFGAARNCISLILAKIHTIEWTPTLLDNEVSTIAMNINWYGVRETLKSVLGTNEFPPEVEAIVDRVKVAHVINGEYSTDVTLFDTPFYMTEEFVAVYRMHSLLPDEIEVEGNILSLQDMVTYDARDLVEEREKTTETFLKAFANTPARILSLKNYPSSLYNLDLGDGKPPINLAEIDIRRDRERNLPRYNDARRQLLLEPYTSIDELAPDEEERALLKSVYTDIEQVDFLVGSLVDTDRPEGFAFGIVPYFIFVVMASRRLFSDRFFMEGLNEENYTLFGLQYIVSTDFHDILKRQFPDLADEVPMNPFLNWGSG